MSSTLINMATAMATISAVTGTATVNRDRSRPLWVHISFTTTATAGNRNLIFTIKDETGTTVFDLRAGANQGASNTYHYIFLPGATRESAFTGNSSEIMITLPDMVVEPNWSITVADENTVDAADSFVLHMQSEV